MCPPEMHSEVGQSPPPLVVHIIYQLGVGGLENGLVNLINHMPFHRYRHAIICLTHHTEFRNRIARSDVQVIDLHKREGKDLAVHLRIWRVLKQLSPSIVHTRNLAGLEYMVSAAIAGVPGRVHSEHGLELIEIDRPNWKHNLLRKLCRPLVGRYLALGAELSRWLISQIGGDSNDVALVYNGVDTDRFSPRVGQRPAVVPDGFVPSEGVVIGTVGRLQPIKDPTTLVQAVIHLVKANPQLRERVRLVIVGDGPLLDPAKTMLRSANMDQLAWFSGERNDVPLLMQALDIFVLPSISEGISNTILEAMATGLPVVATRVGGNAELVDDGNTGYLVPRSRPELMAEVLLRYIESQDLILRHGCAGRTRVETEFSMPKMVQGYMDIYDAVLGRNAQSREPQQHLLRPAG